MTAIQLELAKMRRLRMPLTLALITGATVLFAGMNLFSSRYTARINDPATDHWRALLTNYAMVKALIGPVGLAVVASRQIDIEHQGNGWIQAGMAGTSRARLCMVKITALLPGIILAALAEVGALIALSRLRGCTVPLRGGEWAWYTAQVIVVSAVLLALQVWISARWEPQLPALGVGVLGGFIGMYALLMPPLLAHLLPWGYFSVALPIQMTDHNTFTATGFPVLDMCVFVVAAIGVLTVALRNLSRQEN